MARRVWADLQCVELRLLLRLLLPPPPPPPTAPEPAAEAEAENSTDLAEDSTDLARTANRGSAWPRASKRCALKLPAGQAGLCGCVRGCVV